MENSTADGQACTPVTYTEEEIDLAFAHLEELVEQLPAIREKDARFVKAREARELLATKNRRDVLAAEIVEYEDMQKKAFEAAKLAGEKGDKETEGHNLVALRMYSDLHVSRLATAQRAENALFMALKEGSLTLSDPLAELALEDGEYAALERELLTYRADYTKTYELCLQADTTA